MERGGGGKFSIASFRRNQAMGIVYRYATHDTSRGRRARKRPRAGDKETYKKGQMKIYSVRREPGDMWS